MDQRWRSLLAVARCAWLLGGSGRQRAEGGGQRAIPGAEGGGRRSLQQRPPQRRHTPSHPACHIPPSTPAGAEFTLVPRKQPTRHRCLQWQRRLPRRHQCGGGGRGGSTGARGSLGDGQLLGGGRGSGVNIRGKHLTSSYLAFYWCMTSRVACRLQAACPLSRASAVSFHSLSAVYMCVSAVSHWP